jgi:hypothetical protein
MTPYFDFIDRANLQRPTYVATGSTHTAGYSAPNPPPARQIPSYIVYDPELLQKMRGCLRTYLTTRHALQPVSDELVGRRNLTQRSLAVSRPNLTNEATTIFFFAGNVVPLVTDFVFDVDGFGIQLEETPTSYGAKPDVILGGASPCRDHVRQGITSSCREISELGRANNGRGSALILRPRGEDGRPIIFKVFLPIS